jgi:transcriptional regulator NrdR family protein
MAVIVTKSSGLREIFDVQKLADSLARSGAPPEVSFDIARSVEKQITPCLSTKAIYRLAKKFLRQYNRVSGMRYSLKKTLYDLGQSGY